MTQEHAFRVAELAIKAQMQATMVGHLREPVQGKNSL